MRRRVGVAACLAAAFVLSMLTPVAGAGPDAGSETVRTPFLGNGDYMKLININGFEFDPLEGVPDLPDGLAFGQTGVSGLSYYLVQFGGPITKDMKDDLGSTGATILYYVSYNTFVVRADETVMDRAKGLSDVRWTGPFEPAYKLSPRLVEDYDAVIEDLLRGSREGVNRIVRSERMEMLESILLEDASRPRGPAVPRMANPVVSVEISVFEEWNLPLVLDALDRIGGRDITYSFQSSGLIRADLERASLADLAHERGVMWIDRHVPKFLENDIARWVVQSGDTVYHATPIHDHGIDGTGQTVTLGDSGIDYEHDAYEDPSVAYPGPTHRKVTDYYVPTGAMGDDSDQGGNHGTHTSGTVAGDDGTWYVYDGDAYGSSGTAGPHDGIAFNATLNVQDLSTDGYGVYPPSDAHDLYQDALDRDSWIHSNSWGSWGAEYSSWAAQTDDFIWDNQDFLVIFSAGNDGQYSGALNPEAAAKNMIAVGATENGALLENVAYFSSRGPSDDGRIKPDVMAPGVDTWSAEGGDPYGETDAYIQHSGTSMAAPTVAGSCALIRQYYMDGWYPTGTRQPMNGFTPSAALIKATIINSGSEMTGEGAYDMGQSWYPNNNQGWGRVNLDDSLFFLGDLRGLMAFDERGGLSTGDVMTYFIGVGDDSVPFEISLVWSDYAGTPYSNPNLVNDLDLIITAPDGTVYAGNQYQGYNPGESVKNPEDRDSLNNVECALIISDIQTGIWTVRVSGYNVPMGPQPYALVVTGGISSETGSVSLDRTSYQSDDTVRVRVVDTGLDLDNGTIDTAWAWISSDTEAEPENITLTETNVSTAVFEATIQLQLSGSPVGSDGVLQVQNTDVINGSYYDEDDGISGSGWVSSSAVVDDDPPVISDVTVTNLRARSCKIAWTTDEPADSVLWYGNTTPPVEHVSQVPLTTAHVVSLRGLAENQTYYFAVNSTDRAGNSAYDDNGTAYYVFQTPPLPPSEPLSEEWPSYKNNMARLGESPSDMEPPLTHLWSVRSSESYLGTTPIVSDGVLVALGTWGGLGGWDPLTGEMLWMNQMITSYYNYATPTAAGGVVYSYSEDKDGMPFVGAFDIHTGEMLWSAGQETGIYPSYWVALAYHDGIVFGSGYSATFALDGETGALIWNQSAGSVMGVAVANDLVYASDDYRRVVSAMDEETGDLVWQSSMSSEPVGQVCAAGDMVYVLLSGGTLTALDAFTGEVVWETSGLGYVSLGTPICDGTAVYCQTVYGWTYAIDAYDGTVLWTAESGYYLYNMMSCANGYLYSSDYYELTVRNATDGSLISTYPTSSILVTCPALSDGMVWLLEESGEMHCLFGAMPVGLVVSPSSQTVPAVPDSTVAFEVNVMNRGFSGPDTFDIEVVLGDEAWEVALFAEDGVTPLEDTDGDLVVDTGPIDTLANRTISVHMTVPPDAVGGDSDTAVLVLTSSADTLKQRNVSVTALVPPAGTSIGPSDYEAVEAGSTFTTTMEVVNEGGLPDTMEVEAGSSEGWEVSVFKEDGVTPIEDTDGDDVPDTGNLGGLESATIVVEVSVPADAEIGTFDRLTVTARSSCDIDASDTAYIILELPEPPSIEWPTLMHDQARTGISPVDYELPLSHRWSSNTYSYMDYSSPVISDRTVYNADSRGYLIATDLASGEQLWSATVGAYGAQIGTPSVADGVVYVVCEAAYSDNLMIVAVDQRTGYSLWSYLSDDYSYGAHSTPAIALGNVYWCDGSGTVYANDAVTGDLVWSSGTGYGDDWTFGPSYWGGMLFGNDLYGGLFAMDATTGEILWTRSDLLSYCSPVIADGVLYVGDYLERLSAVDPFTGETVWCIVLDGISYMSSPLCADGKVFIVTRDYSYYESMVWAVDAAEGEVLWSNCIDSDYVQSSPAYTGGVLFTHTRNGHLFGWDGDTGAIVASLYTNDYSYSSPAIGNGYMVLGSNYYGVSAYSFRNAGVPVEASVDPDPLVINVGETGTIQVSAIDVYGNRVVGVMFEWESLEGLGSVYETTEDGSEAVYLAGRISGTDTLRYSSSTLSGTVEVEILPGEAVRMVIDPSQVEIDPGETIQFHAAVTDELGNEWEDMSISWSCTEGTVDSDGTFVAPYTAGTERVTAGCGEMSATATIAIIPGDLALVSAEPSSASVTAGSSLMLTAAARDMFGNQIPGIPLEWSCSLGSIHPLGDFNESAVLVAPTEPWSTEVMVSAGGFYALVSVEVTAGPLDRILLTPESVAVRTGEAVRIEASWVDAYGNELEAEAMDWECTVGGLDVSDDGLSAEFHAGSFTGDGVVEASYDDMTGTASVTVTGSFWTSTVGSFALGAVVAAAAVVVAIYMLRRKGKPPGPAEGPQPPDSS